MVQESLPNVFIGSSKEGLPIAKALQLELVRVCVPHGWWSHFGNSFGPTNIDQLLDLMRFDFAVLILSGDDQVQMRQQQFDVPRDNLIFELGLFIGAFGGLDRAIFLTPVEAERYRLPSDLFGIHGLTYRLHLALEKATLAELRTVVSPAAIRIADFIKRLGAREQQSFGGVGVSSHIVFHPVIQFRKETLRFKLGYTGEGLLYDASFRLYYVEPRTYEDGGPSRSWTELELTRRYIPEIRFTFHLSHKLSCLQLPGRAQSFDGVRTLPGIFHITVIAVAPDGRQVRNRRVFSASQILKGRFVSINDEDLPPESWVKEWDQKPTLNWAKFEEFQADTE
jgi:hypothetical protein